MPVLFSSFESKNIPVKSKKIKESRNTPKEVAKVLKTEEKKAKVLTTEEKKDRYKEAI